MIGIAEISAGLSSLKAAKDIVQGLNAAATQTSINEVKIELQGLLLDANQGLFAAQAAQAETAERIRQLEQQIVELENWKSEKQRYQLSAIGSVGFAYTPKEGMERGEPMHWLCQPCFDSGHKTALQFEGVTNTSGGRSMMSTWHCSRCGNKTKAGRAATPSDPSTW